MTEEEAKGKVCPHKSMFGISERSGESYYQDGNCIASDCMMWKWEITARQAAEIKARGNALASACGCCGLVK